MPNQSPLEFLLFKGAEQAAHLNGSLLAHLQGTRDLLVSWGCDDHVCVAGLFHSVYGTSIYDHQAIEFNERHLVQACIGTRGEELAFLFCVAQRPKAFLEALDTLVMNSRLDGMSYVLDEPKLTELIEIECANLIEQGLGQEFLREIWAKQLAGVLRLRPRIVSALAQASANTTATSQ